MTIVRHYRMTPQPGRAEDLTAALIDLAKKVRPIAGCEGLELRPEVDGKVILFTEHWSTIEAHKAAGAQLSADDFAPVMGLLAEKPDGGYFNIVALD